MALVINTNLAALNAQNKLNQTSLGLGKVFERLSSGLRINRAADDAAGLGVASSFEAEVRSMRQAMRNANDGISLIQVAEGAANEVANILIRMKELATQAASGTLGSAERAYIQDEFVQLSAEVDRIASVTEFNGITLSTGSSITSGIDVQVGASAASTNQINITLGDLSASALGVLSSGASSISMESAASALAAMTALDTALSSVNSYRSDFGALQNRLESTLRNAANYTENIDAARSRIIDADFAMETANLAKLQILQQAGVSILGQANAISQAALRLLG